jgi:hypothetical protein
VEWLLSVALPPGRARKKVTFFMAVTKQSAVGYKP